MDTARYGSPSGPRVTPRQFIDRATPKYEQKGIFPYCEACHEVVHLYGVNTTNLHTIERFDHANRDPAADPLDDCILADRESRFKGLAPSGWDDQRGHVIRQQFFQDENLRVAYGFCLAMCRHGNLPFSKFSSMVRRADQKRVWAYADIPVWAIAYILLTLETFTGKDRFGRLYEFYFSFEKPRRTNVSSLWEQSMACKLVKLFPRKKDADKPVMFKADDNPFPVSAQAIQEKVGDTSWMKDEFILRLKALA